MTRNDTSEKNNRWLWRLIIFLSLVCAVLGAVAISKEVYRKRQVQKEIDKLKVEADKIKKENLDLEQKLSYLSSQDYQEKEAKDKLNLQSPGENVVVVKPGMTKREEVQQPDQARTAISEPKIPNQKKWWDYFFKY